MKIGVMQPYLFPYLGYFQLIQAVDKFILFDDVNYIKKGWINKNRILLNDAPFAFSVPVSKVSQNKKINEHYFSDLVLFRNKFLKTLSQAYQSSEHYERGMQIIEDILSFEESNVSSFIANSITILNKVLKIETDVKLSSENHASSVAMTGEDRIIKIVSEEGGDIYINAIGGTHLYDRNNFVNKDISLKFLNPISSKYWQQTENFVSGLSIIDVLMNCSPSETLDLLNNYSLIESER